MKRNIITYLKSFAFALALLIPVSAVTQQQPYAVSGALTLINQHGAATNGSYTATAQNGVQSGLYWTVNGVLLPT